MTFQCTLNTRLKKIVVVAANSKQYFPLQNKAYLCFYPIKIIPLESVPTVFYFDSIWF